jgi:hypothetical protein
MPNLIVFGNPRRKKKNPGKRSLAGMLSRHVYQIRARPRGGRVKTIDFGNELVQARAHGNGTVELRCTEKGRRPFDHLDGAEVQLIRYRHVEDGEDYQHDFEPGVFLIAPRGTSAVIFRPDGLPVWKDFA